MNYPGKPPTPTDEPAPLKKFYYKLGAMETYVRAHNLYFYESGHVGFWEDLPNDERRLILAVKADEVWEDA